MTSARELATAQTFEARRQARALTRGPAPGDERAAPDRALLVGVLLAALGVTAAVVVGLLRGHHTATHRPGRMVVVADAHSGRGDPLVQPPTRR